MSYNERVRHGKSVEDTIVNSLRELGYYIAEPTPNEDMHKKIDGHIFWEGQFEPLQVKYRSTGDDMLMEVAFLDQNCRNIRFNGRDFKTCATLFASLARDGKTIRICSVDELRFHAERLTKKMIQQGSRYVNSRFGQLKRVVDSSSGRPKIIFFVKPRLLRSYVSVKI